MSGYLQFSQYYDALTTNVDYPSKAQYFDHLIRRHIDKPGLLLDLACGTGSLSLELAALGYDVIGVDASAEMLSIATQKVAVSPYSILFLCQSMEELDLYGTVDVCICALDSLNHLPDEAALCRVLERLALFVAPGGLFLFDVNTAYKHRSVLADSAFVYDLDTVYCVWQNTLLKKHDTVEIQLDFFEKTGNNRYIRSSEHFQERIFSHNFIVQELQKRQFIVLNICDGEREMPPNETTQRLVYLTQKQG